MTEKNTSGAVFTYQLRVHHDNDKIIDSIYLPIYPPDHYLFFFYFFFRGTSSLRYELIWLVRVDQLTKYRYEMTRVRVDLPEPSLAVPSFFFFFLFIDLESLAKLPISKYQKAF